MWLPIALTAQFILGTSAVFDKLLLRRGFFDPWVYTFWIGMFGLAALVLAPFGFSIPESPHVLVALSAGAIFITALFFLFTALTHTSPVAVLTFTGALTPVASFILASLLLDASLNGKNLIGFSLLLLAGFAVFISERDFMSSVAVVAALGSALLFGCYGILAKTVFTDIAFITGFIFIKLGSVLTAGSVLFVPRLRRRIIAMSRNAVPRDRLGYAANVLYAGSGSTLVSVAISLAHPALVEATQSLKYVVIFFCSWLILHERYRGLELWGKISATVLVAAGASVLAFAV